MTFFACTAADVGLLDTCMCCGGSATLGGTSEPVIGKHGRRYCSLECHDEWEGYLAEQDEKRAALCRVCDSPPGQCVTEFVDVDGVTVVPWPHEYERSKPA